MNTLQTYDKNLHQQSHNKIKFCIWSLTTLKDTITYKVDKLYSCPAIPSLTWEDKYK